MGIYDRDYERSYDTGSGWRDGGNFGGGGFGGGFASWSANGKLLAVLIGVFVLQNLVPPATEALALPSDWLTRPWRLYGLVTYALLHGGFGHILWNSVGLFFLGSAVNRQLGDREYLAFFFASAVVGGLVWTAAELAFDGGRSAILLGASAGLAGVVVLFCLRNPNATVYAFFGLLPIPAAMLGVIFVGGDIYRAYHSPAGGVAYTAHLGGALFAFLYHRGRWSVSDWLPDWLLAAGSLPDFKKLFKRQPKLRVHREDDDTPVTPADDRVDEILRKIQAQGQDSLTREEQRLLERASRRYKQRRP